MKLFGSPPMMIQVIYHKMNKMSKKICHTIRRTFSVFNQAGHYVGKRVRRIIPKPILQTTHYLLQTIMRFPYWTYIAFRKYIPGYKKLPHYLQEGVAIFMCFVTIFVG